MNRAAKFRRKLSIKTAKLQSFGKLVCIRHMITRDLLATWEHIQPVMIACQTSRRGDYSEPGLVVSMFTYGLYTELVLNMLLNSCYITDRYRLSFNSISRLVLQLQELHENS